MFFVFVFRDWLPVAAIGLTQYVVNMHLMIVRVVLDILLTVIATKASLSWRCEIICLNKTCMIVHVHQPICPPNYSCTRLQTTVSIVVAMVSTHVIRTNKEETVTCPWSCPHLLHVWASKQSLTLWLSEHIHVSFLGVWLHVCMLSSLPHPRFIFSSCYDIHFPTLPLLHF